MITQSVPIYSLDTAQLIDYAVDPQEYVNTHDRCYFWQHDIENTFTELFFGDWIEDPVCDGFVFEWKRINAGSTTTGSNSRMWQYIPERF